ncbi:MAG: sulfatase-like hydrolase/transferase, partial [Planctomycetota bacterium]
RIPMGYGDPFADQPLPDWMTPAWKRFKLKAGPHSALDLGMYGDEAWEKYPRVPARLDTAENLKRYIDAYDASIHYLDSHLGRLFDKLEALGIVDDTHVIVSADHGECQGDLGIYGEHGTADRGTCRIPMLFRGPGVQPGVDRDLHYHLDLAPTLMDLLGGSTPALWDGQSFHASLTEGAPVGRDSLVLGQCAHVCQRSVRFGDHLYIRTYHDGFHGFPQEMLFDLASDPHEQINLSDQRPERCREALAMLTNWHDAQMHRIAENANDAVDPLWTVIHEGGPFHAKAGCGGAPADLNDYVRRLTDTGRSAPASLQRAAARRDA